MKITQDMWPHWTNSAWAMLWNTWIGKLNLSQKENLLKEPVWKCQRMRERQRETESESTGPLKPKSNKGHCISLREVKEMDTLRGNISKYRCRLRYTYASAPSELSNTKQMLQELNNHVCTCVHTWWHSYTYSHSRFLRTLGHQK